MSGHNHNLAKQLMVLMAIMTLIMNWFKVTEPATTPARRSGGVNLRRLNDNQMSEDESVRMHEKNNKNKLISINSVIYSK